MASQVHPVALVTGASRGIGRCDALALADAGCDVVIAARTVREGEGRSHPSSSTSTAEPLVIPGSLDTTAAEIERRGRRSVAVRMDLMDEQSVADAAKIALEAFGRIDILVNNAIYQGPGSMDRLLDLPLAHARNCLVGDYLHPLYLTQLLLPQMLERGAGRIVNISSEAGFMTPPAPAGAGGWGVAYAAAKAAFHRVTDVCHVEFFSAGIWAFSVAPGLTVTESMKASGAVELFERAGAKPAPPEVAGAAAAWLATSPEAGRYAGQMVSSRTLCKEHGLLSTRQA